MHLADSAKFEGVTFYKLCNGLTGSCFELPNDTIHVTVSGKAMTTQPDRQIGFFLMFRILVVA